MATLIGRPGLGQGLADVLINPATGQPYTQAEKDAAHRNNFAGGTLDTITGLPGIKQGITVFQGFQSVADAISYLIGHLPQLLLILFGFSLFVIGAMIATKIMPGLPGGKTYTFKYKSTATDNKMQPTFSSGPSQVHRKDVVLQHGVKTNIPQEIPAETASGRPPKTTTANMRKARTGNKTSFTKEGDNG